MTKIVEVVHSHEDSNGNPYYRTVPHRQLICIIDGAWHTATDDRTWEEPIGEIDMDKYDIKIVKK